MSLINTLDKNMSSYTRWYYLKTQLACNVQRIIWWPSAKDYKRYVSNNDMVDLPISLANVNAAEDIFGKYEGSLKENITWYKINQAHSTYINTPLYLIEKYQPVTLYNNLMFVNSSPFFITISHHIKFIPDLMTEYQRIKPVI